MEKYPYSLTDSDRGSIKDPYAPIKEYEGYHRYDPSATWSPQEEGKLVRKLDFRIMFVACIMFFALQIDRGNIKQALSDNMLKNLHLTTNDYNTGMTIFYISFMCAELPSQLISKRLGADVWLPIQLILWSTVTFAQYWLNGKTTFYITRSLIGLLEGGFIPDMVLFCSYFYKTSELTNRLAYFWVSNSIADITGAFLAFGILRMRTSTVGGWRYLFLIEGLFTFCIGLFSLFYLPASPTQTKSWWSPNGWFSERDETILVNRVLRDDYSKGDMNNRTHISLKALWSCLKDYDMWPLYLLGFLTFIPVQPPAAYLTLTLKAIGFDTFQTNLLTIPSTVLHIILLLLISWISVQGKNWRIWTSLSTPIWLLLTLIGLRFIPGGFAHGNKWVIFVVETLVVGYPYCHAILVSWTSRNANSVQQRAVSSALYNIFVQAGSIVASNIYRANDAPNYVRGNNVVISLSAVVVVAMLATKYYYIIRNQTRSRIWEAMTSDEQHHYTLTTLDKGSKRLDFRFGH